MQIITNLDKEKLGAYKNKITSNEVILTDERLYEHIMIYHKKEYEQLKPYIKYIIDYPDFVIEDNRHSNTLIYLKYIKEIEKGGRIVIKLALGNSKEHNKNSIITLMRLNDRTWKQTLKNRGKIIWKRN